MTEFAEALQSKTKQLEGFLRSVLQRTETKMKETIDKIEEIEEDLNEQRDIDLELTRTWEQLIKNHNNTEDEIDDYKKQLGRGIGGFFFYFTKLFKKNIKQLQTKKEECKKECKKEWDTFWMIKNSTKTELLRKKNSTQKAINSYWENLNTQTNKKHQENLAQLENLEKKFEEFEKEHENLEKNFALKTKEFDRVYGEIYRKTKYEN